MYSITIENMNEVSGAALAFRSELTSQSASPTEYTILGGYPTADVPEQIVHGTHYVNTYNDIEYDDVTNEIFSVKLRVEEWDEWEVAA